MKLLARLNLRQNWPLVIALSTLFLSVGYNLIFQIIAPLDAYYSKSDSVFVLYPLMIVAYSTNPIFAIGTLALTIILAIFSYRREGHVKRVIFNSVLLLGGVFGLILALEAQNPCLIGATVLVILIFGVVDAGSLEDKDSTGAAKFRISGIMILVSVLACNSCLYWFVNSTGHHESTRFQDRIFNIAVQYQFDMDGTNDYFELYKCDSLGLLCQFQQILPICCTSTQPRADVHFTIDSATNSLYIQIGDEKILVAQ